MSCRWISIILCLALAPWAGSAAEAPKATRAIVLSWDGAVPEFVHDLLRRGKMPNLAKMISGGAFSDSVITVFPSKTAPGHASLWTGAPPRVNGISGNRVPRAPRSQFTILETVSGFDSGSLRAEPIWVSAARAGRRVVIVQATQAWPPHREKGLIVFEGYAGVAGREGIVTSRESPPRAARGWKNLPGSLAPPLEIAFEIGLSRFFGLLIDDPTDPLEGYDTLVVAREKDAARIDARLKAGLSPPGRIDKWSGPIAIKASAGTDAGTYLRLFELRSDASYFLIYHTRPARTLSSHPEFLLALEKEAGAFIGNGASALYRRGALGAPVSRGGDGTAERRYLETVLLTQRQLMNATRWAIANLPWDLLLAYSPYPDESEHLWRGHLEATLPEFRSDVARQLRPFLEEVYRSSDDFLGLLLTLRPKDSLVALVSDHGMEGVSKVVNINAALGRAGLLSLDGAGRVDLEQTKAFYPFANNGYILLNTKDRKGGIVDPADRKGVVAEVRAALEKIVEGGRRVVTALFDAATEGEKMGIGGETGGDIYLDLLPGYDFDPRTEAPNLIGHREPYGTHLFNPLRSSMRTIMALHGPGVAPGGKLGAVRTIDFAPTLARLMGIPPPRDARGAARKTAAK